MNCPICNVGLKIAGGRRISVNFCPLCGGTWLDKGAFDRLPSIARTLAPAPRPGRRLLRIGALTILTALILAGALIATISVGAIKLWPTFRGWADALLTGKEISIAQQVSELASRLDNPRLARLSEVGLDGVSISALLHNSSFEPLLRSVAAVPELGPLVRDGTYLKVVQEAGRQNVQNLLDVRTSEIVSADVRSGAERIQQLLRSVPGTEALGAIDPAVAWLLSSDAFKQLCASGFFESLVGQGQAGSR